MKRYIFTLLAVLLMSGTVSADEGMWLIHLLEKIYPEMKAEGLRLKPDQLYDSESGNALADAVVMIDGGMGTGSMISDQGLMITNHHVAYGDICKLSTPERNILFDGFWARNQGEELPVEGKKVMFLRGIEDITAEANHYRDSLKAVGRWGIMGPRKLVSEMERRHRRKGLESWCAEMWDGRLFLMLQYEVYTDVRLVGAPPARIGSFGGETDNWSWPQHKGDFALYRIYGNSEGRPAAYSTENRPIKPRRVLPISTRGVEEGDFAMVIGFPGITHRYGSSMAVSEKELKNPIIEQCRHNRMEIIRRHMEADSLVRLAYSDGYFNLSNYADYVRWEQKCLKRYHVCQIRALEEAKIQQWIEADPARKAEYGNLLSDLKRGYEARRKAIADRTWYQESWFMPSQALIAANRVASLAKRLEHDKCDTLYCPDEEQQEKLLGSSRPRGKGHGKGHGKGKGRGRHGRGPISQAKSWATLMNASNHLERNYEEATDRELFVKSFITFTREVPEIYWGDYLRSQMRKAGGDARQVAESSFDGSFCRQAEPYRDFLLEDRSVREILDDPLVALALSVEYAPIAAAIAQAEKQVGVRVIELEEQYRDLQYRYREAMGVPQYPNANSTMRLTYGTVQPISPVDGIRYASHSTIRGYLEKENPENYDYVVDQRMKELIRNRDWDRWGDKGELKVNLITNNDITGGNSGSPMLNGRGELIGLAFDGNRESMSGDLWFHPDLSRTVAVDIRYVMWVIEKWADAGYLLEELQFDKR